MQTTFFSNLFARRPAQKTEVTQQAATAPVELQVAELEQVAGGMSLGGPNGTWAAASVVAVDPNGPNGSW